MIIEAKEKQVGFVRGQRDRGRFKGDLQIFELKQIADKENHYKTECRKALALYKNWSAAYREETDMIELFYGHLERNRLRRHAQDMVRVYWVIRQDFRYLFSDYLEKSSCYPPAYQTSKAV